MPRSIIFCLESTQGCLQGMFVTFNIYNFCLEKQEYIYGTFIPCYLAKGNCYLVFTVFPLCTFFIIDYAAMQDKKLPENSIHDLAYDLIKALQ